MTVPDLVVQGYCKVLTLLVVLGQVLAQLCNYQVVIRFDVRVGSDVDYVRKVPTIDENMVDLRLEFELTNLRSNHNFNMSKNLRHFVPVHSLV